MSKAVLLSIRPKWCEKIISGEKTIEVRKTRPRLQSPFKCYIYCTMDHPYISVSCGELDKLNYRTNTVCRCNGKVIGEFVCDDIFERIVRVGANCEPSKYCICDWNMDCTPLDTLLADACLTKDDLEKYLDGGVGYGWHISDLRVYDRPRDLWEFTGLRETKFGAEPVPVTRPPQSWCYVKEQKWND